VDFAGAGVTFAGAGAVDCRFAGVGAAFAAGGDGTAGGAEADAAHRGHFANAPALMAGALNANWHLGQLNTIMDQLQIGM
jgi:hypothetical protein